MVALENGNFTCLLHAGLPDASRKSVHPIVGKSFLKMAMFLPILIFLNLTFFQFIFYLLHFLTLTVKKIFVLMRIKMG